MIALGIGLRLIETRRTEGWLVAAMGFCLIPDAATAIHQVGLEQHWWAELAACEKHRSPAGGLPAMTSPRCNEPAWSLWGFTMAGWNAAVSILLFFLAVRGAVPRLVPGGCPAPARSRSALEKVWP